MSSQFSVVGGRMPPARGRGPEDLRPPSRVFSGQFEGWGSVWHPPRDHDWARAFHICWPTSAQEVQVGAHCNGLMPNSPRNQGCSLRPISPKILRGASEQGSPPLHVPQSQGGDIPAEMMPLNINIGDTHWVYCHQVKGCLEWGTLILPCCHIVLMCTASIWAKSCHVPSAPLLFLTPMPSNGMASGHITLGPQTQLKECYTCMYKKVVFETPNVQKEIQFLITFNHVINLLINHGGVTSPDTVCHVFCKYYFIVLLGCTAQTLTGPLWGVVVWFSQWGSCAWTKYPLVHLPHLKIYHRVNVDGIPTNARKHLYLADLWWF